MASVRELEDIIKRTYARLVEVGEAIPGRLMLLSDRLTEMENRLMAAIDDLKREVSENKEVISSAVTLITGLRDQVAALKAAAQQNPETDPQLLAQINDLAVQLDTNSAALANALVENTPVEDEEEPAVQEPPVIPTDPTAPPTVEPAPEVPVEPSPEPAAEPVPGTEPQP